jgi:hypothetical protein
MGMMTATYVFPGQRPAFASVVEHVARVAQEAVLYDEGFDLERDAVDLQCPAAQDWLWLAAVDVHGQRGYQLSSTAFFGSYLWDATAAVLRTLGGEGPVPRHDVLNRPWRDAQALYPYLPD